MNFAVTTRPDADSERRLRAALNQFPVAVQDAIVRKAMRPFLQKELKLIRAANAGKLPPNQARAKIKIMRSGIAWGAAAYKIARKVDAGELAGRAKRAYYDSAGVGWRSHFTELGTHAWSSSLAIPPSARARGKGWKRGLKHRNRGTFIRGTHASEITARMMAPQFMPMVVKSVNEAILRRKGPRSSLLMVGDFA
jgi:hypothetical protein